MNLRPALLVFLLCAPDAAVAGEASSRFQVAVTVVAGTRLEVVQQPASFVVSNADAGRGTATLTAVYRLISNDARGVLLRFAPRTGLARSVRVQGLGSPFTVETDVVEVHRPAQAAPAEIRLRFEVLLREHLPPGQYPMPVLVSASGP